MYASLKKAAQTFLRRKFLGRGERFHVRMTWGSGRAATRKGAARFVLA
jgi:hypothetical protein